MLDKIYENKLYRANRTKILFLFDSVIVLISYLIAYWARIDFAFRITDKVRNIETLWFVLLVVIIYAISFFAFKIYKSLWIFISSKEVLRLAFANIFATALIMIITWFSTHDMFFISVEFIAGLLSILMMFSFRTSYRLYRRYTLVNNNDKKENVLIIGAGSAGNLLLKEILQNDNFNYKVIGFVDDVRVNLMVAGYPVLGTTNDLVALKEKYKIDTAIIAIRSASKADVRRIVEQVQQAKLNVKIMGDPEKIINNPNMLKQKTSVQDVKIEDLLGRGEIRLDQKEIEEYISNRIVCVTGAGGSIGSELCRQIIKFKPNILLMIDINENALYMLEQEFNRDKVHGKIKEDIVILSTIASIRDKKAINELFAQYKPDVVYHAAAHKHVPLMETRPMEAIKNNVFGTNNVIQCCIKNKVKRFIMISTDKAVNPTNVMGATKRMTEMILQANGNNGVTKMAAVRFGNVLGSNGSVIPIFKKQIEEGGPVTITDKKIIRYFMTIPEAAQLVLQAGYYADSGEIFVLDMGEPVKIIDLAEKLIRLSGFEPYEDIEIREIGLRPGEKMFEELHLGGETFEKTKNDLIFKNHVMRIEKEEIEEILEKLDKLLKHKNTTNSVIKKTILDLIISD
ncbi:MAG: polysaccharide biosynthesis protein [Erysipelotrichia bacterium]|nr:polysaccharide biosynthesis protein [Erysipelotrichia bacterium]NCC55699.1 polysaccharide biosynthesis protein [Erysipelotrichia bacterium]